MGSCLSAEGSVPSRRRKSSTATSQRGGPNQSPSRRRSSSKDTKATPSSGVAITTPTQQPTALTTTTVTTGNPLSLAERHRRRLVSGTMILPESFLDRSDTVELSRHASNGTAASTATAQSSVASTTGKTPGTSAFVDSTITNQLQQCASGEASRSTSSAVILGDAQLPTLSPLAVTLPTTTAQQHATDSLARNPVLPLLGSPVTPAHEAARSVPMQPHAVDSLTSDVTIPSSTDTSRTLQIRQHQLQLHGHEPLDPLRLPLANSTSRSSQQQSSSGNEEASLFELPAAAARSSDKPNESTFAQGAASSQLQSSRLPSSLQGGSIVSATLPSSYPTRDAFGATVDDAMAWSVDSNSHNIHNTAAVIVATSRPSRRLSGGTTGRTVLASKVPPTSLPTANVVVLCPAPRGDSAGHHEEARFTVSGFSDLRHNGSTSVASSSCNTDGAGEVIPPPPALNHKSRSPMGIASSSRPVFTASNPLYVPASSTSISTRALLEEGEEALLGGGSDPPVSSMMPFSNHASSSASRSNQQHHNSTSGHRTQSSSNHDGSPFRATLPRFGGDAADHSRSNAVVGVTEPPGYSATFDETFDATTVVTTSLQSSYAGGGTTTTSPAGSGPSAPPTGMLHGHLPPITV